MKKNDITAAITIAEAKMTTMATMTTTNGHEMRLGGDAGDADGGNGDDNDDDLDDEADGRDRPRRRRLTI